MEFEDVLRKRGSVRKYRPESLTDQEIRALMEAAMLGPSGMNLRPYRFIVVRQEKKLNDIKSFCPYAKYNAPNAILVIGDTSRSPHMWGNDCGAATENILLEATNLGLGTVWCAMYPFEDRCVPVKKLLELKPEEEIYSLILIGRPDEEKGSRGHYEEAKVTIIDD